MLLRLLLRAECSEPRLTPAALHSRSSWVCLPSHLSPITPSPLAAPLRRYPLLLQWPRSPPALQSLLPSFWPRQLLLWSLSLIFLWFLCPLWLSLLTLELRKPLKVQRLISVWISTQTCECLCQFFTKTLDLKSHWEGQHYESSSTWNFIKRIISPQMLAFLLLILGTKKKWPLFTTHDVSSFFGRGLYTRLENPVGR